MRVDANGGSPTPPDRFRMTPKSPAYSPLTIRRCVAAWRPRSGAFGLRRSADSIDLQPGNVPGVMQTTRDADDKYGMTWWAAAGGAEPLIERRGAGGSRTPHPRSVLTGAIPGS